MAPPGTRSFAVYATVLLALLVISSSAQEWNPAEGNEGSVMQEDYMELQWSGTLNPSECWPRCSYRCSATSHKKPCMYFCQKCCAECLCVPPGTYGNKETCPCYNNWKTQQGGPKCP